MLYNWAAEHPDSVGGIAGIYPVCNLRSWPGLDKACGAYGLTAEQLDEQLAQHNPIDRLAPLAKAGVPIFHIHGDTDDVVPLQDNSALLASRYRELGGSMRLRIPPGQGHNVWDGFFQCQELVEFVIAHASPAAEREPSAALFRDPPMEARPGAFWDWMNGNVDLDRMTYELEEMKAKGMSGVEIWDIGVIRPIPEENRFRQARPSSDLNRSRPSTMPSTRPTAWACIWEWSRRAVGMRAAVGFSRAMP